MHTKPGSMILTCIFFISVLTLIMLLQWRSQEALQNVLVLRTEYVKKQYAVEALLKYGVTLCKKQYSLLADTLETRSSPLLLTFNRWPLGGEHYAEGIIEITCKKALHIMAYLCDDEHKKMIAFSCDVEKKRVHKQDVYSIASWKKHVL